MHKDVADPLQMGEDGHPRLFLDPRHKALAAARHDDVDVAAETFQHFADGGPVAGRYKLDRRFRKPRLFQALLQAGMDGQRGIVALRTAAKKCLFTLGVAIAVTLAVLVAFLLARQRGAADRTTRDMPRCVRCGDCPELYINNPDHPEISTQGLRDREFAVPKPPGLLRILVLGDSVAFGHGVAASEAFPRVLEDLLNSADRPVEVVNGGNGFFRRSRRFTSVT